jgi:hypothetical protein
LAILQASITHAWVDSIMVHDSAMAGNTLWSPDSAGFYLLSHSVFVEDGDSLTIEPGTIIKSEPGRADSAARLVVARKGYIYASGTPTQPIIFTCQADDVLDPDDLPTNIRGQWGGIFILGVAGTNRIGDSGHAEGIPITEQRAIYGPGSTYTRNDEDNSGVFRYVSIRYNGSAIDAELDGLMLAAVGSGTTIEYVETFNGADDGFGFVGGTVNTRYLVSARCDDDGFDYDEGYRGKNQFWFSYFDKAAGKTGGEHDGGTTPETGLPYATPTIRNATYVGAGSVLGHIGNDMALNVRDNAGGHYINSIFTEFRGFGVQIEDHPSAKDSRERLDSADLTLKHCIFWGFGAGPFSSNLFPQGFVRDYVTDPEIHNHIVNPAFCVPPPPSRLLGVPFDPRPLPGTFAASGAQVSTDSFFAPVPYLGAFDPEASNWAKGWTAMDFYGYLEEGTCQTPPCQCLVTGGDTNGDSSITSADIITTINYVFKGGPSPEPCEATGDVNCTGQVTSADVIGLVNYVFKSGSALCEVCAGSTLATSCCL